MLVGNKLDVIEGDESLRKVTFEEAQKFADKHGMIYMETSAVKNINVGNAFDTLVNEIFEKVKNEGPRTNGNRGVKIFHDKELEKKEAAGCC